MTRSRVIEAQAKALEIENRILRRLLRDLIDATTPLMRIFKSTTAGAQPVTDVEVMAGWGALDAARKALDDGSA